LGNGAKEFPQLLVTISASSERTRFPSASVPQAKGTFPSASFKKPGYVSQVRKEKHWQIDRMEMSWIEDNSPQQ